MSDAVVGALIAAAVTIIGFAVNYFFTRKSLEAAISNLKTGQALDKMRDFPGRMSGLLDKIRANPAGEDSLAYLILLQSDIYAYGSVAAVRIFAYIQQLNYALARGSNREVQWD